MRLGYPCINWSMECRGNKTFRLKSYSEQRLMETVEANLDCLQQMLRWNVENGLYFFRISSDLVPFASHEVNSFDWVGHFQSTFQSIGSFIRKHGIRISMHPDQFTVLNSKDSDVVERSVAELEYHAHVLDAMELPDDAKIQIHVGGVYGDREASKTRFAENYRRLPETVKKRLVIENDDRSYSVRDCLDISEQIGIPVLFDSFHHELLENGESYSEAIRFCGETWEKDDGRLMVDYSSQAAGERQGKHADKIDLEHLRSFLNSVKTYDFDIILEIKDKESSALQALPVIKEFTTEVSV
ncbi:MAG: UV DNA damage repair endonuclease UvsE [Candidatus Marinimicrobia bacterium]|nr:UV DNA damage repair endonuclease UvsE [Candidatus Neomarinimicrobiota bacterium]